LLKLADFGFAKRYESPIDLHDTICGSPMYMAPEIMNNGSYGSQTDIWSIGLILYEMLYGKHPYEDCKDIDDLKNVVRSRNIDFQNATVSNECLNLLKDMLEKDSKKRIGWKDLFDNKWVNNIQIIQNETKVNIIENYYESCQFEMDEFEIIQ